MENRVRKGGLAGVDPAVREMIDGAARNRAAMSRRQRYDAARVRVRVDVPQWLVERLDAIAEEVHSSRTQVGAFLLAYGCLAWARGDEELDRLVAEGTVPSRSINVEVDLELDGLVEQLTNPAMGSSEG